MASDFSVTWQCSQREQFFFVTDQTPYLVKSPCTATQRLSVKLKKIVSKIFLKRQKSFSTRMDWLSAAGLPDCFFSNQKSQFGSILEGPRLENVYIFYGHLKYFTDIWDRL
jgi:hypothetical protein